MSLSHYEIIVLQEYEKNEFYAATQVRQDSNWLKIGFSRVFFAADVSPDERRNTVCHELIHGPVDPLFQYAFDNSIVKDHVAPVSFSLYAETGRSYMERMVDQLANGWAPFLPLPPKFPT